MDKRRKIAEYAYYDRELRSVKSELDAMEAARVDESDRAQMRSRAEDECRRNTNDAERQLKAASNDLFLMHAEARSLSSEKNQLLEQVLRRSTVNATRLCR